MANDNRILFLLLLGLALCVESGSKEGLSYKPKEVGIGVILDMSSPVGRWAKEYISMAVSDFYAENPSYRTKLNFTWKDSKNDVVLAASAALELMKHEEIHAIIGPQRSTEAKFIIKLGVKAKIPIISFSATSSSLSTTHNPFFIRTALDDGSQVAAIATLVEQFEWREVVLIYEDTEYGYGLVPSLTDAFQKIDTRVSYRSVIPPSPNNETKILLELHMIRARETRVLLVHMTASLGKQLFKLAKEVGMMSEAFVWIITYGLSTLLDPMGENNVIDNSMQGVLGVRPYVPKKMNQRFQDFEKRWKNKTNNSEINIFGLWAYDTVWAIAKAVELVSELNSTVLSRNISRNGTEQQLASLRVSESGPMILKALTSTQFKGISGTFHLERGQLQDVAYEIINVVGKRERVIGNWSAKNGKMVLNRPIIWPGGKKEPPKGWDIPAIAGYKLKIGVPYNDVGFEEFLKIEWDSHNKSIISGFSYDIFQAVKEKLPFNIECHFIPFVNYSRKKKKMAGTYDQLLQEIQKKTFDAVVGDTTIIANRTLYVDFTLPYSDSGMTMVVKTKAGHQKNIWIFLKPLSWDLWLTTGVAFIVTGLIIWVLEHRTNTEFRGPPDQQLGTIFWFSFSTLVFAQRERLMNNWSRFVLIIWIFVVLILTQSYTASLASLLTVQQLQPAVVDVNELIRNGYSVGYQKNSYVEDFLITQLNFNKSNLKPYSSPQEFDDALSKGSKNNGVEAIFIEIPNMKVFLAKYCNKYVMTGPTYKSAGFGFAFPIGSPLVPYISRAILNVTQDNKKMQELEKKHFGDKTTCQDQGSTFSSHGSSLSVYSFGGLFIITGLASIGSCLIYLFKFHCKHWPAMNATNPESSVWSKFTQIAKHFDTKDDKHLFSNNNSFDRSAHNDQSNVIGGEVSFVINGTNLQSHSMPLGHGADVEEDALSMEDSGRFIYGGA